MVEGLASLGEPNSLILSASQVLFGTFPLRVHVPFSLISSSRFTFAVLMREVYCVRYTPRAWDPRTL